ncbi:MAG: hypothetical protein ACTHJM_16020 [Marmoricola sp.]
MPITVPIPGGEATLVLKRELTPRREIHVKALIRQYTALAVQVANARKVTHPDGRVEENPDLSGPDVTLTYEQAALFERINYAGIPAYLVSWTLDHPLPATLEAALDIPSDVADALIDAIQKIGAGLEVWEEFELGDETIKDKQSPTGRSGSSRTTSGASATGPKSRRTSKTS